MRNRVIVCAQHILYKFWSDPTGVVQLLYAFVLNRCDEAAIRILTDEALVCDSWTVWIDLSTFERDICLKALDLFREEIAYDFDRIKKKTFDDAHSRCCRA